MRELKVHLFRPNEDLTMCGLIMVGSSTKNPNKVTCKTCWRCYAPNVRWYWDQVDIEPDPATRWGDKDTPLFHPRAIRNSEHVGWVPAVMIDWESIFIKPKEHA